MVPLNRKLACKTKKERRKKRKNYYIQNRPKLKKGESWGEKALDHTHMPLARIGISPGRKKEEKGETNFPKKKSLAKGRCRTSHTQR